MSEHLGLMHVSSGEGRERHIEVFKTDRKQHDDADNMISASNNSLSSDVNISKVSLSSNTGDSNAVPSQVESRVSDAEVKEISSSDDNVNESQKSCEAGDITIDMAEHVGASVLRETSDLLNNVSSNVPILDSSNCHQVQPVLSSQSKTSSAKSSSKKSKDKSSNKVT